MSRSSRGFLNGFAVWGKHDTGYPGSEKASGEPDRFEYPLRVGQQVGLCGDALDGPCEHLLRSAAGRNQTDADFHEPDVAFRRCLHPIAVQDDLTSARERQVTRAKGVSPP